MKVKGVDYIVKKWRVPSKSNPGTFHVVGKTKEGELSCDCTAGGYGRFCKHKLRVEQKYGDKSEVY
jgi:hypothetical protein